MICSTADAVERALGVNYKKIDGNHIKIFRSSREQLNFYCHLNDLAFDSSKKSEKDFNEGFRGYSKNERINDLSNSESISSSSSMFEPEIVDQEKETSKHQVEQIYLDTKNECEKIIVEGNIQINEKIFKFF